MKKNEEDCSCTDECLGYLTMNCKGIETLEEASLLSRPIHLIWNEDERYDCNEEFREEFKKGAKWQQERSYSEEDMQTAWNSSEQNMRFTFSSSQYKSVPFKKWFEKFKNK